MVVVVGTTHFFSQDLLQCVDFNTAFHLMKIETELFLMTFPSNLPLSAVTVVSVYVLKLRIKTLQGNPTTGQSSQTQRNSELYSDTSGRCGTFC